MHIVMIGSGGREHALLWKINQSPLVTRLSAIPGNGGIASLADCIDINHGDSEALIQFCKTEAVDLVVIGPEAPLAVGLTDQLEAAGILVFGPSKAAAQLEASKGFTKSFCDRHQIPTAAYQSFNQAAPAIAYLEEVSFPVVVKVDGLAAGKGVIIAQTKQEAISAIHDIFGGVFGVAGESLIIEAFLEGEEVSVFALCDGNKAIYCGSAQDHKRVGEGDTGLNTGGMGAYSPAPIATDTLIDEIMTRVIAKTVAGMQEEDIPFKGVLFAGFMVTKDGPQLLEYNVRFGDPECQVLMQRIENDIVPLLLDVAKGDLGDQCITFKDEAALCVVLAAKGYPGNYKKGTVIRNLEQVDLLEGVTVFHAGTKQTDNEIFAVGGRVLAVTALGKTVLDAKTYAYRAVDMIDWPEGFCRRDIGYRAVAREKQYIA